MIAKGARPRVAIWRILVGSREEGVKVIDEVKKDNSVKRWTDLARERSLDKATNMRGVRPFRLVMGWPR